MNVISLVRVDNRLIHGQVVEAWLPVLKATRVVVADDEATGSPLVRAAMGLAVPRGVEVSILSLSKGDLGPSGSDGSRTLFLVRDVEGLVAARARGLPLRQVNLGNVHFATGRRQVSSSVFLSRSELDELKMLDEAGVTVEARAVPTERAVSLSEMQERFSHVD